MNSIQRHELRYQRRKKKREEKRESLYSKSFDEVFSLSNIIDASRKCCNGSRWKASTIDFESQLLSRAYRIYKQVRKEHNFSGFYSFKTIEHGKVRNIDALKIEKRAAQKCFCKNYLTEFYSRSFIKENAASLKGKGMDFSLRTLKKQLATHYKKYGLRGGIYQFDLKNYFASLPHDEIKRRFCEKTKDERLKALFCAYVNDFNSMRVLLEEGKGVGLGSEISQIIALDFMNPLDHFIKDVLHISGYGRYMDDGYIVCDSLERLKELKQKVSKKISEMGIQANEKKNIITPFFSHSFTFLKMRITLKPSGKIVYKIDKKSIQRVKRKIKYFFTKSSLSYEDIYQSYQSWRAHAFRADSFHLIQHMDSYFKRGDTFAVYV